MLFVLIPLSLLAVGLVAAGRIIYRKIPRDLERWNAQLAQQDFGPTFYQKSWAVLAQESKKFFINTSTKAVHRLKIATLKTDNFFGKLLQEMRQRRQRIHENVAVPDRNESVIADGPISESVPKTEPISLRLSHVAENGFSGGAKPAVEFASKEASAFAAKERQYISQLAYNPKDVAVYKKLGWLYLENTQPFQARQAFKMAVKLGSKDKNVITKLLEMGGVVHKEGNAPSAVLTVEAEDIAGRVPTAKIKSKSKIQKSKVQSKN